MIAFTVFLVSLILLGAAVTLRLRLQRAGSGGPAPVSAPAERGQDLLPVGSGSGDGLAAFYAYQMAAGSIDRSR